MRRSALATLCLAVVAAGCGSSSTKTHTTPATPAGGTTSPGSTSSSGGSVIQTGSAGTMGPPSSGNYNATNATVLSHVETYLVKYFTTKGFTGVTANCVGTNSSTATCTVAGTNSSGSRSAAELTISVNQTTGALRIAHAVAINTSSGMTSTGPAGTMGPPSSGSYSTSNPTVLQHIDALLVRFFTSKGFSSVSVNCEPVNATTVDCTASGTNSSGTSAAEITVSVNPSTGALSVLHVQSVSGSPSGVTQGPAGTMGPASQGQQYSATNHTVLQHIANTLGRYFVAKHFSNVHVRCVGVNASTAFCRVAGTNSAGQTSSAIVTIAVNRTTGALRIAHVS